MAPLAALKAGGSLERTAPCSRAARQQSRLLIIPSPSATRRHLLAPLRVAAPEAAATAGASGASAAAPAPRGPSGPSQPASILKISPQLLATGGLDPSTQPPEARASFSGLLTNYFLPVNLDYPGLRILNIDPPVIAVQNFLTAEECDALRSAASGSGRMSRSQVQCPQLFTHTANAPRRLLSLQRSLQDKSSVYMYRVWYVAGGVACD